MRKRVTTVTATTFLSQVTLLPVEPVAASSVIAVASDGGASSGPGSSEEADGLQEPIFGVI